jgi:NADPH:quinone reductase-like Zn-dependent oxidoreductase
VLAEAGEGKRKGEKNKGDYVTIGGGTAEWLKAGVKRVSGIDLFAKGRELFWIRFPGCGKDLEALRALAEEKRIKPRVAQTFPLTSRGARDAFAALHSRRTVGKVVVVP